MLMKMVNKKQENIYGKKIIELTTELVGAWWPNGINTLYNIYNYSILMLG